MASKEHGVRSANGVEIVRRERWSEGRFVMTYVLRTSTQETVYEDCADADAAWLSAIGGEMEFSNDSTQPGPGAVQGFSAPRTKAAVRRPLGSQPNGPTNGVPSDGFWTLSIPDRAAPPPLALEAS